MIKNKKILVLFIPIIVLILMIILPLMTYLMGETIILKTRPYDPRDLFRGDYVSLDYEIEEIEIDKFEDGIIVNDNGIYKNEIDKVYIVLKDLNGIHTVDYVAKDKPKNKQYLFAKIQGIRNAYKDSNEPAIVMLDCGLDNYFVPENTGMELEEMSREGALLVEVKTLGSYAILKSVYPME
ncbi:GDYXXLXY domain-containing protein [Defluviitalea phaphyphila]|uniref:GDYXXLXY domain-containing protein n=1 Tax=Defluviitalea phaphyphila TaxID=1473580 RepID=UPI0011877337|nr:GDYXXLXY domain-containing protein [Defluviitalea phaphyphila]